MGKWINKIGIEVECGVYPDEAAKNIPGFNITSDGSLRRTEGINTDLVEYVSEAHKYPDQMEDMAASVNDIYDIVNDINDSMGLHIHVSFNKDEYYYRIASKKFHDYFVERLKGTDLWENNERLRKRVEGGENNVRPRDDCQHFCKPIENPKEIDQQLQRSGTGLKYKRIVYFKHKYDTVEFRLFPAMDTPEEVAQAVNITSTAINSFLQQTKYTNQAEIKSYKRDQMKKEEEISAEQVVTHNV